VVLGLPIWLGTDWANLTFPLEITGSRKILSGGITALTRLPRRLGTELSTVCSCGGFHATAFTFFRCPLLLIFKGRESHQGALA